MSIKFKGFVKRTTNIRLKLHTQLTLVISLTAAMCLCGGAYMTLQDIKVRQNVLNIKSSNSQVNIMQKSVLNFLNTNLSLDDKETINETIKNTDEIRKTIDKLKEDVAISGASLSAEKSKETLDNASKLEKILKRVLETNEMTEQDIIDIQETKDNLCEELTNMITIYNSFVTEDIEESMGIIDNNIRTFNIMIVGLILAILAIVLVFRYSTMRKLGLLNSGIDRIGELDFSQDIITYGIKDDIADISNNINSVRNKLVNMIEEINNGANISFEACDSIRNDIGTINKNGKELIDTLSETKNSVSTSNSHIMDISATVEELTARSEEVSSSIISLAAKNTDCVESIKQGVSIIDELSYSIKNIDNSLQNVIDTNKTVRESSYSISKMLDIIQDIASETDLLALNATIEAARVGEQGKGFYVIANNIKKLADHSKQSVHEISEIVYKIASDVESLTVGVDSASKITDKAIRDTNKTCTDLIKMVDELDLVNKDLNSMSETISEIANGVDGISNSVSDIAKISGCIVSESESLENIVIEQQNTIQDLYNNQSKLYDIVDQNVKLTEKFKIK